MKKTILVNLIGAAGSGKSLLATEIFSKLKRKGYNCEYVPEVAKGLVYEENFKRLQNQLYVLSMQYFNLDVARDKVDIVVTDSPLVLAMFYNRSHSDMRFPDKTFDDLVMYCHSTFDNLNYFIQRNHPYKTEGRYQSEQQARQEEEVIENIVKNHNVKYKHLLSTDDCVSEILFDVEQRYKFLHRNGTEIERKFLLDYKPNDLGKCHKVHIKQGYFLVDDNSEREIRVRQADDKFFRTEKIGTGLVRKEFEEEISQTEFDEMLKLCGEKVISKDRYYFPLGANLAELDLYENIFDKNGEQLKTAEVEFQSKEEAEKFRVPAWFGEEITNNKNYKNSKLATTKGVDLSKSKT